MFLGCPGVGKGTYASRLSTLLGVPHIATGDLVREELSSGSSFSKQVFQLQQIVFYRINGIFFGSEGLEL